MSVSWVKRAAIVLAIVACVDARAHSDTPFYVLENGNIEGMPPEYGPVQILHDSSTLDMCATSTPTLAVRFGEDVTYVPSALMERFGHSVEVLAAHGSWYHYPDTLPPNLAIELSSGRFILFNLETGEVLVFETCAIGGFASSAGCVCEKSDAG